MELNPSYISEGIQICDSEPLEDGTEYTIRSETNELVYEVPEGALGEYEYLTYRAIQDGKNIARYDLSFFERESDRELIIRYNLLQFTEARVVIPLNPSIQHDPFLKGTGAMLRPIVEGQRVDMDRVDEIRLTFTKTEQPLRVSQTPIELTTTEPEPVTEPAYLEQPLLDRFGQSTLHDWEGKTESRDELTNRLTRQRQVAETAEWPDSYSKWGGWNERSFEATGFFRTEHDGERWWLVDPDGHPFISAGVNCVAPSVDSRYEGVEDAVTWLPDDDDYADAYVDDGTFNYLIANFIRTFGDEWREAWNDVTESTLLEIGFNTIGNWSSKRYVDDVDMPYVRQLDWEFPNTPDVDAQFPDVYHESFENDARSMASQLESTKDDPYLVGYFLSNHLAALYNEGTPAGRMLRTARSLPARHRLVDTLREEYGTDKALADAWNMDVTFRDLRSSAIRTAFTEFALDDLRSFSCQMLDRLYRIVDRECKQVDPNHLNLGPRFAKPVPVEWAWQGLTHFDVVSTMSYWLRPPFAEIRRFSDTVDAPVLISEWTFGALDVGLPATCHCQVRDQASRGTRYRTYVEQTVAQPWCVGTHWFQLYDQSAIGREDGENYNVGFLDTCNRRYRELCEAARTSHERLYGIAEGAEPPASDRVEFYKHW